MFLLKKIVGGLGGGKTSDDPEGEEVEPSRSRSPSDEVIGIEDEGLKAPKLKRGRSSRSTKRKKTDKRKEKDNAKVFVEPEKDNVEKLEDGQDIGLTSENIVVKLNGVLPTEDNLFGKNEEDESKETVNFDDFWADFDEIEGKPRKPSGASLEDRIIVESSELSEIGQVCNDVHADRESVSPLETSRHLDREKEDCSDDLDDFWSEKSDVVVQTDAKKETHIPIDDSPNSESSNGCIESNVGEKDLDNFWADRDDDCSLEKPFIKSDIVLKNDSDAENSLSNPEGSTNLAGSKTSSSLSLAESEDTTQNSNRSLRNGSEISISSNVDRSKRSSSRVHSSEEVERETWATGLTKSCSGATNDTVSRTENTEGNVLVTEENGTVDSEFVSPTHFENSPSKEIDEGCDADDSADNFWGDVNDDIPPVYELKQPLPSSNRELDEAEEDKSISSPVDAEDQIVSETLVEEKRELVLENDNNEDNIYETSKGDQVTVNDDNVFETAEDKEKDISETTEDDNDDNVFETAENKEDDISETTEDKEENISETAEDDEGNISETVNDEEDTTSTKEETENTETISQLTPNNQVLEGPQEEDHTDGLKHVKDSHKRNFAKALRDIEAPTRRRSVVLSDNRERVIPEERVVPLAEASSGRQHQTSESSVDETSGDDDGIMDYLGKENKSAEARLAARRQARVEAREIRMRELERVQKEQEENSDKLQDLHGSSRQNALSSLSPRERPTSTNSYHSSRRSSEDSMEDGLSLRDIRHELKEVEEKFRKAMIANAQLDNEKAALTYQVELLKDRLEELEEAHSQLGREHRERCREHEALKRAAVKLKEDLNTCRQCLEERDRLIADYGLVIVGGEVNDKGEVTPRTLISSQSAEFLDTAGEGSLDVRLKALAKEKNDLLDEVRHYKLELEEERNRRRNEKMLSNGPVGEELQQTLSDYSFRLQKAEQDTSTLQATVTRLENQVARYKSAAETSEKAEDELKVEKRKLQREHRESIARIEELETANSHLQRRMDKLKNAKSTLLKEL